MHANTILIIEDDQGLIELLKEKVKGCGYQPVCVQSAAKALDWLKEHTPLMMILDYCLPDMNGKEFLAELRTKEHPLPPFIISTGQGDERIAVEMMKLGARDYIIKDRNFLDMIPMVISQVAKEIKNENKLRLAEEVLRESENKYRSLIETTGMGYLILNRQGSVVDANQEYVRLTGHHELSEILGRNVVEWTAKHVQQANAEAVTKCFKEGGIRYFATEYEDGKGLITHVEINATVEGDGESVRIISLCHDITGQKRAKDALQESEEKYRLLHENAGVGIGYFKPDGTIISYNKLAASHMNGLPEDFTGKTVYDIFSTQEAAFYLDRIKKATLADVPFVYEDIVPLPKGNKYFLSAFSKISDSNNTVLGIQIVSQDITERKLEEQELIIAKERAEESDRLKSAFLANVSHEIRTPMNCILGFAELLKEPQLTGEKQQNYISIIKKSGKRMLNIINDIVNISKIESGQMNVIISATNINDQIESVYDFFTPEVEKKGLQLSIKNTLPSNECRIKTDLEKLYAILSNLVDNAFKFTNAGSIEFGVEKKGGYLEFFVKDTGCGVPDNQKEIIFERFRQGSELITKPYEGAGLGLSISKGYVEILGGKIWVESVLGKGSTFFFTIPYNDGVEVKPAVRNVSANIESDRKVKDLKVLIAEDDEASVSFLSTSLKMYCREILTAGTGVETVESCLANPDLDIILMDVRMPEMDGYTATRQIRKFNKDVIIIAQTGYAMVGDREKAIETGCNGYISKPIDKDELLRVMQKYFKK